MLLKKDKNIEDDDQRNFPYISAVILCAGNSSRMGSNIDKQFVCFNGIPVIAYAIMAFQNCELIDEIVLVTKDSFSDLYSIAKDFSLSKVTSIVEGGKTRTISSRNGVLATNEKSEYILIHDGARPFVSTDLIENIILNCMKYNAVAPAIPVRETVKTVDSDNFVSSTLNRSELRIIQTPQAFLREIYLDATENISEESDLFDDCQLVEMRGHKIYLVSGEFNNIKITYPEDLVIAEAIANSLLEEK